MKISDAWIRDLVAGATLPPPADLARLLTSLGHAVDAVIRQPADTVYDLDITSNRPDCLSHVGIARELAASCQASLAAPAGQPVEEGPRVEHITTVVVDRPELCPRYCARVLSEVRVGESPVWLRERLEALGQRSINNVVDVTNYVMLETGHPVHAFDLDRLGGRMIRVRLAEAGERLRTLDGVERVLDAETLVIADQSAAVALAGIMGGEATEVTAATRRVLVESAAFEPRLIRRASKRLALRTEASTRFEKGCDIDAAPVAAARVCQLLQETGATVARGYIDVRAATPPRSCIELDVARVRELTGVEIDAQECVTILERLGFGVRQDESGRYFVKIPSYRVDVSMAVDLIEEIARLYGYDRIPAALPPLESEPESLPIHLQLEEEIRDAMTAAGLTEVISYSFVTPRGDAAAMRPLLNPISERTHLRNTLLVGLLEAAEHNLNNGLDSFRFFEIGHVFELPDFERSRLGVLISEASGGPRSWRGDARPADFHDLKGVLEGVFDRQKVAGVLFDPAGKGGAPQRIAMIRAGEEEIGWCERHRVADKHAAYYAEIDLGLLLDHRSPRVSYRPLVRFPASWRDVSFLADEGLPYARIENAIRRAAGPELIDLALIDLYRGEKVPAGRKSMAVRMVYQSAARTLTSAEVEELHARCVQSLELLGAEVRGR